MRICVDAGAGEEGKRKGCSQTRYRRLRKRENRVSVDSAAGRGVLLIMGDMGIKKGQMDLVLMLEYGKRKKKGYSPAGNGHLGKERKGFIVVFRSEEGEGNAIR